MSLVFWLWQNKTKKKRKQYTCVCMRLFICSLCYTPLFTDALSNFTLHTLSVIGWKRRMEKKGKKNRRQQLMRAKLKNEKESVCGGEKRERCQWLSPSMCDGNQSPWKTARISRPRRGARSCARTRTRQCRTHGNLANAIPEVCAVKWTRWVSPGSSEVPPNTHSQSDTEARTNVKPARRMNRSTVHWPFMDLPVCYSLACLSQSQICLN